MTRGRLLTLDVPRPSSMGAGRWSIYRLRAREWLGRALNRLHVPGAVAPGVVTDPQTGRRITIRVGPLFVVFSVDGRDYYFRRFSGTFDGVGAGC
jgi:hypothetical protein